MPKFHKVQEEASGETQMPKTGGNIFICGPYRLQLETCGSCLWFTVHSKMIIKYSLYWRNIDTGMYNAYMLKFFELANIMRKMINQNKNLGNSFSIYETLWVRWVQLFSPQFLRQSSRMQLFCWRSWFC